MTGILFRRIVAVAVVFGFGVFLPRVLRADEVLDWNRNLLEAARVSNSSGFVTGHAIPILGAAIFDAVNGIERRYTPIHVTRAAPRGASRRAAVVQAAYATLIKLFPNQKSTFDEERAASLAAIRRDPAVENSQSVARGIVWGQTVANAILAWRSTDGFTTPLPPFLGGTAVGEWRPTPPGFAPGAGQQFAYMTPWVITSPSQFRPNGPPALNSYRYIADFNETKLVGSLSSVNRTADQALFARFWQSLPAGYFWAYVGFSLAEARRNTLSENARLFALLNIAIADATIACWDAKYYYVSWRPVTAIRLASTDGNPDTTEDLNWAPLIDTPPHPEYPSAHSTISTAAVTVLADYFGEETAYRVESYAMVGVVRSFSSFSAALDEIRDARIFGGIHFRSACEDGQELGTQVAHYVIANSLQPIHGNHQVRIRD